MKAGSLPVRALEELERFLYRASDHIVVVTESFVQEIAAHGIDHGKLSVVTNGVDLDLFRTVIPSKMFEFMAAARPIVSTVDGESRRILDRAGAGFFSPPEDAEALARLVSQLSEGGENLDAIGRRGRAYVEQHYSRPALA